MWNNHYRWIFVHLEKCAGTSIEYTLSVRQPSSTGINNNFLRHRTARPFVRCPGQHWGVKDYADKANLNLSNFFIFSSIRNPWDRMVSWYYHLLRHNTKFIEIKEIRSLTDCIVKNQQRIRNMSAKNRFCINGKNYIDHIIKVENFKEDTKNLYKILHIKNIDMHINHDTQRPRSIPYQEYYSPALRDLLGELMEWDIHTFNYEF